MIVRLFHVHGRFLTFGLVTSALLSNASDAGYGGKMEPT